MKNINGLILLMLIVSFSSCETPTVEKKATLPKAQVSVTNISQGYIPDYINFSGKTIYMSKNSIYAPISGYIVESKAEPGKLVKKGDILFIMKSRESYVLENNNSGQNQYGEIIIKAVSSGIITELKIFQSPIYINDGSLLCSIVDTASLYANVEIPYEYVSYAKKGNACEIILPDNSKLTATFTKVLNEMNMSSQTINVLTKINSKVFIPENMIIKVLIDKGIKSNNQILPKSCVLTDPLMRSFWVMKLINDTTAVKVGITKGKQNHDFVEIMRPEFQKSDRIINEGGYGLSDTVFVEELR